MNDVTTLIAFLSRYQVLYQVGVTISRSSGAFIHISNIHIFSILQVLRLYNKHSLLQITI